jgi:hypothetical protein
MNVILNLSKNEFCLMASEDNVDYRAKLTNGYLKIHKVKVSLSISVAHEVALKKETAIYPISRMSNAELQRSRRKPLSEERQPL